MADRFGAAQPIVDAITPDWLMKMLGIAHEAPPPPQGSPTNAGQLPPAWEKANQDAIQQQMHPQVQPMPKRRLPGK